jgi:hypothetical protein
LYDSGNQIRKYGSSTFLDPYHAYIVHYNLSITSVLAFCLAIRSHFIVSHMAPNFVKAAVLLMIIYVVVNPTKMSCYY